MDPDSLSEGEELAQLIRLGRTRGWLSVRQAAKFFPQHYLTVRGWVEKGYLQSIPVGTRKVVTLDEIDRFKSEGNYKDAKPTPPQQSIEPELRFSQEADSAGGGNTSPVADPPPPMLGDYDPNA